MLIFVYSLFFAFTVITALMVVFSRHSVYSALYLVASMVGIGGLFILINAQLAFVLQIIVYTGAIMVVFLFVIMLLNQGSTRPTPLRSHVIRRLAIPLVIALGVQITILVTRFGEGIEFATAASEAISAESVALILLTRYIYAFEITSIMLLIAVVGAMTLARKFLTREAPGGKGPARRELKN